MNKYFQSSWTKWKLKHLFKRKTYKFRHLGNVWEDINIHPFDLSLDQLAQVYLGASSAEKIDIEKYIKKRDRLSWSLVLYVRRAALRLQTRKEDMLVHWAMGMTLLALKSDDPRDILNSLILLKISAEKIGLDLKSLYIKIDPSYSTNSKSIFYKVENQPNDSITYVIKNFGPPEWSHQLT